MLVTIPSAFIALSASFLITPIIRKIAIRFKIFASPNDRTIHRKLVPKLGGVGIFVAFISGMLVYAFLTQNFQREFWGLLAGGAVVLFIGFFDDLYDLGCYRKLIGQTLAALIAVQFGFVIRAISLPLGGTWEVAFLGQAISVFWIVLLTNAINLLDGLDGLASGLVIFIALFLSLGAAFFGHLEMTTLAIILIASILGFFRYNSPPAKIFMGDSGSLFLGFTLGCLSLTAFSSPLTGTHFQLLLALFLIPLADTTLAILRRLFQKKHIFSPDKKHIHHRLLELGFSQSAAAIILNSATIICGVVAISLMRVSFTQSILLLSGLGFIAFIFLNKLRCFDFIGIYIRNVQEKAGSGSIPNSKVMSRNIFQTSVDHENQISSAQKATRKAKAMPSLKKSVINSNT